MVRNNERGIMMKDELKNMYFEVNIEKLKHYLFGMTQEERDKDFDEWWESRGKQYYQELKESDAENNIYNIKDLKLMKEEL